MGEKKRVFSLIFIMAASALIVAGVSISTLYRTAFKEEQARLVETAQSQARLIEAVARFDQKYSKKYPGGAEAATLNQIIDAHENYAGFGETGEFTLSKKEDNNIVFLLSHRHSDLDRPKPISFQSDLAEPMRMALLGRSGTVIGLDYRGEVVLAAHEPVAELGLGIVAKIDLSEIRAPFLKAGAIAGLFTVLIVLAGASLFIKITNPMLKQLETRTLELETMTDEMKLEIERRRLTEEELQKSEQMLKAAQKFAKIANYERDFKTGEGFWSDEQYRLFGYKPGEIQHTHELFKKHLHPEDRERIEKIIETSLATGESFETDCRYIPKNGDTRQAHIICTVQLDDDGKPRWLRGTFQDITDRKRIEDALQSARDNLERQVQYRTAKLRSANELLNLEVEERIANEKKMREQQDKLRSLSSQLLLTEERERRRIATELHDRIGQTLAVTKIKLGELREASTSNEAVKALDDIREFIDQTIQDTRSLTFELSPPILYELGLEAALAWLVDQTRQKHGLQIEFSDDGQPKPLDYSCRVIMFQAARELIFNIVKHARAHSATVSVREDNDAIRIDIEDDGLGFDISKLAASTPGFLGFGLFSIRERIGPLGGRMEIQSGSGSGTRATIVLPLVCNVEDDWE